jgi:hypothetical protein
MQFGPDRILACPICGAFAKTFTLISGNTFGAIQFTDGSMIAMSLPDVPRITKCKKCGTIYWLDDENSVWDPWGGAPVDPEIRDRAERVEPPTADDFAEALTAGLADDVEKETYLRVKLWWAANKQFRTAPKDVVPEWSAEMAENLDRLAQLCDESDVGGRLMKAEIARETRHFDQVADLLDWEFPEEAVHAASVIRGLAAEGIAVVRMIPHPSREERGAPRSSPAGGVQPPDRATAPERGASDAPRHVPPGTHPDTEYFPKEGSTSLDSEEPEERCTGRSFSNFQVRSDHPEAIEKALDGVIAGRAYISAAEGGWVQVCDEASESADVVELFRIARELSARLCTGVVAFLMRDERVLWYWFYESGVLVDQFDSWPNYFKTDHDRVDAATRARIQGKPEVLSRYCLPDAPANELEDVLKPTRMFEQDVPVMDSMPYVNEEGRLRHLATLLGFSEARCCLGFTDFAHGTFFFTLEDVYTEGAMAENRAAAGGFRLIGDRQDQGSVS